MRQLARRFASHDHNHYKVKLLRDSNNALWTRVAQLEDAYDKLRELSMVPSCGLYRCGSNVCWVTNRHHQGFGIILRRRVWWCKTVARRRGS
ncbi:hypothetical protein PIB30_004346 [Stylosanthes scabra]|uniref:Uncharacterized protein n=1 Tax=Stylosanthes scabra TaxID=79078 RepID=A0ABU6U2I0_9FABA|nr:hypothetical protein [Stylosanthes scabra]